MAAAIQRKELTVSLTATSPPGTKPRTLMESTTLAGALDSGPDIHPTTLASMTTSAGGLTATGGATSFHS